MQIVFFMALVGLAAFCQNLTGFAFGLIFCRRRRGHRGLMNIADAANVACLLSIIINGVSYMRAYRFQALTGSCQAVTSSAACWGGRRGCCCCWLSGNALNDMRMLLGLVIVLCAMLLLMQKKALDQPSALSHVGSRRVVGAARRFVCHARPAHGLSPLSSAAGSHAGAPLPVCHVCLLLLAALPWWLWREKTTELGGHGLDGAGLSCRHGRDLVECQTSARLAPKALWDGWSAAC